MGIFGKLADYVAGATDAVKSGRGITAAHRAGKLSVDYEETNREHNEELDKLANQLLQAWVPYSQTISSPICQADVDNFLQTRFRSPGFQIKGAVLRSNPNGVVDAVSLLDYFRAASAERQQIPDGEVGSARGFSDGGRIVGEPLPSVIRDKSVFGDLPERDKSVFGDLPERDRVFRDLPK